jgi:hypothetical protein
MCGFYKGYEARKRFFQRSGSFVQKREVIIKMTRLQKIIFREIEAFV